MTDNTEQLKEKGSEMLVKMIDFSIQSMSDVVDFGKQQIPQVIHELLMWKATSASVWMAVGVILLILGWITFKAINRTVAKTGDEDAYVLHLATGALIVVGGLFFIPNLLELLQILVAPKVYLIEYSADLIKKA